MSRGSDGGLRLEAIQATPPGQQTTISEREGYLQDQVSLTAQSLGGEPMHWSPHRRSNLLALPAAEDLGRHHFGQVGLNVAATCLWRGVPGRHRPRPQPVALHLTRRIGRSPRLEQPPEHRTHRYDDAVDRDYGEEEQIVQSKTAIAGGSANEPHQGKDREKPHDNVAEHLPPRIPPGQRMDHSHSVLR